MVKLRSITITPFWVVVGSIGVYFLLDDKVMLPV